MAILDVDFGFKCGCNAGYIHQVYALELIRRERTIFEVLTTARTISVLIRRFGCGRVDSDRRQIGKFISSISLLDKLYDVILIDTGAGLSKNVMSFILAADEVLLVTTPEPTAITDAYAMIKMISKKDKHKVVKVVVNKAESYKEANDILDKLFMVSDRFYPSNFRKQDISWRMTAFRKPLNSRNRSA